jgi:hypothetical protein
LYLSLVVPQFVWILNKSADSLLGLKSFGIVSVDDLSSKLRLSFILELHAKLEAQSAGRRREASSDPVGFVDKQATQNERLLL